MINEKKIHQIVGVPEMTYSPTKTGGERWQDYFGVELELEGPRSYLPDLALRNWHPHRDGSLRNGMEYVLATPRGQNKLALSLEEFYASGITGNDSLRASTHIHINGKDMTVGQLRSLIALVYSIEPALFMWVDESRKWSGYCMGLDTMSPKRMRTLMSPDTTDRDFVVSLAPNGAERYYGLNIGSLRRHGSVEFRYFPGAPTREQLETWLDLVEAIKLAAMATPIDELVTRITSQEALMRYLAEILPDGVRQPLLAFGDPELFWAMFTQIATMCDPTDGFVRRDPLVKVTRPLITYLVKQNRLSPLGADFLLKVGKQLQVMTTLDFRAYYQEARNKHSGVAVAEAGARPPRFPVVMPPGEWRIADDPQVTRLLDRQRAYREQLEEQVRLDRQTAPAPRPAAVYRNFGVPQVDEAGDLYWAADLPEEAAEGDNE